MKQGLYGWLNKNMKGRKGQQGFTLIELLVVVTILGILAAIVTLSLVGLTTNASIQSCNQEYKTVQAAIDAAMANNNLATITGMTVDSSGAGKFADATNLMTTLLATTPAPASLAVKLYNANPTASTPNYTRNGKTQFWYTWDSFGRISGIWDVNGADMQGKGCKVT